MRLLPFEYAVRNLGRSPIRLVAAVLGSALVVLLVLTAGGFVRGMERNLTVSSSPNNVMLLGAGSEESVERSQIDMSIPTLVGGAIPGIKSELGVDFVSPEVHLVLAIETIEQSEDKQQAIMRGITPAAFLVHPQVRIIEGHPPRPGENEIIVGRLAATMIGVDPQTLAVGQTIRFDEHDWTISGTFAAPHTVMDAEIWVPLTDLQIATRRDTLSCVVATLDTATFDDVSVWAAQRLDLELVAIREADYYASLLDFFGPVRAMVWVTAGLIALGGLFGGVNTMYAAFAARVRELGALQTLGFPRRAIVISFLQESLLANAAGGIIAATVALLLLDGLAVRFSMGAFALQLDAPVLLGGLLTGAALAIIGVIPPLCRCLRLPIVEALRSG